MIKQLYLKKNIICGYVFGLSFNSTAFYWIGVNSGADLITVLGSLFAAVFYLASFWAGAGFLFSLFSKEDQYISGNLFFPFIIVMVEYVRSYGALWFPWSNLALSQSKYIYFIQFMEVTGTYGVSFVIIGLNIVLYNVIEYQWESPWLSVLPYLKRNFPGQNGSIRHVKCGIYTVVHEESKSEDQIDQFLDPEEKVQENGTYKSI